MAKPARVATEIKLAAGAASLLVLLTLMAVAATPLAGLDAAVMRLLPPVWGTPTQSLWLWVTEVGTGHTVIPVVAVSSLLLFAFGRGRQALAHWGCYLGAQALVQGLKAVVARPRPPLTELQITLAHAGGLSFPSGHAASAIAVYGFLAILLLRAPAGRGFGWAAASALGVLIIAIALSRLFLGVHYASDVLGGLMAGGLALSLAATALRHRR